MKRLEEIEKRLWWLTFEENPRNPERFGNITFENWKKEIFDLVDEKWKIMENQ